MSICVGDAEVREEGVSKGEEDFEVEIPRV